MTPRLRSCATAVALCLAVLTPAPGADAATPRTYSNCAAVHKVYSGGIAKPGVRRNTLSDGSKVALGGHVKYSRALYNRNRARLDRDNDGIACEILP